MFESDIASCFESIPHDPLQATLGRSLSSHRSRQLVGLWLAGFGADRGIAQGAPISPLLANLYLDPLDRSLAGRRIKIVRYADVLVLLTRSAAALARAERRLKDAAASLDLALNVAKKRRTSFAEGFTFLGQRLPRR